MKLEMMRFRNKAFVKVISIILLQCFLVSNTAVAAYDIDISKEAGRIITRHEAAGPKTVFHIQDAHCNYEAQINISRILEELIRHHGVDLVAVEGADEIIDTGWFKALPDMQSRQVAADHFLKKGEITGAEFLSITSNYPFTIYGVEDRNLYIKNLNLFLKAYPHRQALLDYYEAVKKALHRLKRFIYSEELALLDEKINQHRENTVDFSDYVKYLHKLCESKEVSVEEFKNLSILVETLKHEKKINFDTVNEERNALIEELNKRVSNEEASRLAKKSLEFKLGKIEPHSFYLFLARLAVANGIAFVRTYANLNRYIIYSRLYSKIDERQLFDELDTLTHALKERMFVNSDQRALDRFWTTVRLTSGFVKLELLNKEYDYYLSNKKDFAADKLLNFVNKNCLRYGLQHNLSKLPRKLKSALAKFIQFYEVGLARDRAIVKNTFKAMKGKRVDSIALITGGFHTKGISKLLEEKGASYVVVSPVITKDSETPYMSVLTGQETSTLQFTNRLCSMSNDWRIGRHIRKAARRFLDEVADLLVKLHLRHPSSRGKDPKKSRKSLLERFSKASRSVPYRSGTRRIKRKIAQSFPVRFGDADFGEEGAGETTSFQLHPQHRKAIERRLLALDNADPAIVADIMDVLSNGLNDAEDHWFYYRIVRLTGVRDIRQPRVGPKTYYGRVELTKDNERLRKLINAVTPVYASDRDDTMTEAKKDLTSEDAKYPSRIIQHGRKLAIISAHGMNEESKAGIVPETYTALRAAVVDLVKEENWDADPEIVADDLLMDLFEMFFDTCATRLVPKKGAKSQRDFEIDPGFQCAFSEEIIDELKREFHDDILDDTLREAVEAEWEELKKQGYAGYEGVTPKIRPYSMPLPGGSEIAEKFGQTATTKIIWRVFGDDRDKPGGKMHQPDKATPEYKAVKKSRERVLIPLVKRIKEISGKWGDYRIVPTITGRTAIDFNIIYKGKRIKKDRALDRLKELGYRTLYYIDDEAFGGNGWAVTQRVHEDPIEGLKVRVFAADSEAPTDIDVDELVHVTHVGGLHAGAMGFFAEEVANIEKAKREAPVRFGDADFEVKQIGKFNAEKAQELQRGALENVTTEVPTYDTDLGSLGNKRARSADDIFTFIAEKAGIEDIDLRHNVNYGLRDKNAVPTCQIANVEGRLVIEYHGEFDRDFQDISNNNLEFGYTYTKSGGERVQRRVNLAQSLGFKVGLHEMEWLGRRPGHASVREGILGVDADDEAGKSKAARFTDDACMLWYLASYKAKDVTMRQNPGRLASRMWQIIKSPGGEETLPRLHEDEELAKEAIGLALLINDYYYSRETELKSVPSLSLTNESILAASPEQAVAALETPLSDEDSSVEDEVALAGIFYRTRSLADLQELSIGSWPIHIRKAADIAKRRVEEARTRAFGDPQEKLPPALFEENHFRGRVDREMPYDVLKDIALASLYVIRKNLQNKREDKKHPTREELLRETHPTILLGNDIRNSSPYIKNAIEETLIDNGAKVVCIGSKYSEDDPLPHNTTPMMLWTQNFYHDKMPSDATIMITASHLGEEYNGLYFTIAGSYMSQAEVLEVIHRANAKSFFHEGMPHLEKEDIELQREELSVDPSDARKAYMYFLSEDLKEAKNALIGKKIVLDAGNGTGGFYADILRELGVDVVPLHCDIDGSFPHHTPNPYQAETLNDLRTRTRDEGADLGIAFDSDCDRIACVDSEGNIVDGNQLLMLLASSEIESTVSDEMPGERLAVVSDNSVPMGLIDMAVEKNITHEMTDATYAALREKALELDGETDEETGSEKKMCIIAGARTGNIIFKQNHFISDAMYTANQILKTVFLHKKDSLNNLEAGLPNHVYLRSINPILGDAVERQMNKGGMALAAANLSITNATKTFCQTDNLEAGTRFAAIEHGEHKGWALYRPSTAEDNFLVVVEGKTLDKSLSCAREACNFLLDHQDKVNPRPLIAFKQGLEIANDIVQLSGDNLDQLNNLMDGIFAPLVTELRPEDSLTQDESETDRKTVDPFLVACRMNAVRQAILKSECSPDVKTAYFRSFRNRFIVFMKRDLVAVDWTDPGLDPFTKRAKQLLMMEFQEADSYMRPIEDRERTAKVLESLEALYGEDVVSRVRGAIAKPEYNEDEIDRLLVSNLLLDPTIMVPGKPGKVDDEVGEPYYKTPSLRSRVERAIGIDIVGGQRVDEESAIELASLFMESVAIKLAETATGPLGDYDDDAFAEMFNKNFGCLFANMGGGLGQRFGMLVHKGFGTPYFAGTTNVRLTIGGAFHTPMEVEEGQKFVCTGISDFSVFQDLDPALQDALITGEKKFDRDFEDIRPTDEDVAIPLEAERFSEAAHRNYPAEGFRVGLNARGYGGNFLTQLEKLVELQREGQVPDVPYIMRLDVEASTLQDPTSADVGLIAWMKTVAEDNLVTIATKDSRTAAEKGIPRDLTLFGNTIFHLVDWRNMGIEAKTKALRAVLSDPETGKPNPGCEDLLERVNGNVEKRIKPFSELPEELQADLISDIHNLKPSERTEIINNANVVVVHRAVTEKQAETGKTLIEMIYKHPELGGEDKREGIEEYAPADMGRMVFDWFAERKKGERPPVGYVRVPVGADSIKDSWKQNEFNRMWQTELRKMLGVAGINISELKCVTVHPGPDETRLTLHEIKTRLFGPDGNGGENAVFVNTKKGKVRCVKLSGNVHIDLTTRIHGGQTPVRPTTLHNATLLGWNEIEGESFIANSVIQGNDAQENIRPIGLDKGVRISNCYLKDDKPVTESMQNVTRVPEGSGFSRRRDALRHVYERSGTERDSTDASEELVEVLTGEPSSDMKSLLLQEEKTGTDVLRAIKNLRANALGIEGDDDTLDLERGDDFQYVARQVIANIGLFSSLYYEDPAVVGQPFTTPLMPENLTMLKYTPDGTETFTAETLHNLISMFGRERYRADKKQNLRMVDCVYLPGEFVVGNEYTRIGNGTFIDGLMVNGRFYAGDGWGIINTEVGRKVGRKRKGDTAQEDSIVCLGDHKLIMDDRERVTSYKPPQDGDINSLTLLKGCNLHAKKIFIGVGAGEWRDEHRGRVIEDVTFEGNIVIIPEGTEIKRGERIKGLRQTEEDLAAMLLEDDAEMAYERFWSVLSGELDADCLHDKPKLELTAEGRFTSLATALCLLVGGKGEKQERVEELLLKLEEETRQKDDKGNPTPHAIGTEALNETLRNKLYVISHIIDRENIFEGWLEETQRSPRPPPRKLMSLADLRDEVDEDIDRFKDLFAETMECVGSGIEPEFMTVHRPVINLPDGTEEKRPTYKVEMVKLSECDSAEELGMLVKRHAVVKDPKDLQLILRAYRLYVNLKHAEQTKDFTKIKALKISLNTVTDDLRKRWGAPDMRIETVVALYVAVFGPKDYIGISREEVFRFLCFRGGRGAKWFLDEIKAQLAEMGIEEDKIDMTMLPGATDDGRSWLLCSLIFDAPGMPDIGKCLMDLARDTKLAAILGETRFDNKELLVLFNSVFEGVNQDAKLESAQRLVKYGGESPQKYATATAINEFVALFNTELDRIRQEIDPAEAKEIAIHTLAELREGIIMDPKAAEAIKNWQRFVRHIWEYLTDDEGNYISGVGEEAEAIEAIVGKRDAKGNLVMAPETTAAGETIKKPVNPGCLLSNLDEKSARERIKVLENTLNEILTGVAQRGHEQVVREFLYAEFCANMRIPKFGTPLRSMALVGAHIYFERALENGENGLTFIQKDGTPLSLVEPDVAERLNASIEEMRGKGVTDAELAWYLTVKLMEVFLDTQGTVKPATLLRYHLSGVAAEVTPAGIVIGESQYKGSEDSYNEVPPPAEYHCTVLRKKPVLDVETKNKLHEAILNNDIDSIIEILDPALEIVTNPEAIEAIKEANFIVMFPTTLISNIISAILAKGIGEAVLENDKAITLFIHNALFESDPPGTSAASMFENLLRFLSRKQRFEHPEFTPEDWKEAGNYFTYATMRPVLFRAYRDHYVASDSENIPEESGVSCLPFDIESREMSAKGKYLAPLAVRNAVLQPYQLSQLGFRVDNDGSLKNFAGREKKDAERSEEEVFEAWNDRMNLNPPKPAHPTVSRPKVVSQPKVAKLEPVLPDEELLTDEEPETVAVSEEGEEQEMTCDIVSVTENSVGLQYTVQFGDSVPCDRLQSLTPHTLFVEQGTVRIHDQEDSSTIELEEGDSLEVSGDLLRELGQYRIETTDGEEAIVNAAYSPSSFAERIATCAVGTVRDNKDKIREGNVRVLCEGPLFRSGDKREPGSFMSERGFIRKISDDAATLSQWEGIDGLLNLTSRPKRDATDVVLLTRSTFEKIKEIVRTGVETYDAQVVEKLQEVLKNTRILLAPDITEGEIYNLSLVRGMISAGVVLGNTTEADINSRKPNAQGLMSLMSELTGQDAIAWDHILALLAARSGAIEERASILISNLLPVIVAREIDKGLRSRIHAIWQSV